MQTQSPPGQEEANPDQKAAESPAAENWGNRTVLIILIVMAIALAVLLAFTIVDYLNLRSALTDEAFANAWAQAFSAAEEVDQSLIESMAIAEGVATDLESGALPNDEIETRLRAVLEENPVVDGLTVAFEPYTLTPEQRLHSVYVYHGSDEEVAVQAGEPAIDYTRPAGDDPDAAQTDWYAERLNQGPSWSEPFQDTDSGKTLVQYGLPFYRTDLDSGERVVAGVVTQDFSLVRARERIEELNLGETGFGALFTQNGAWLTHPVPEFVGRRTIYDDGEVQQDADFQQAAERSINGESTSISRQDPFSGDFAWDFFAPIASTGWVLVAELAQAEYLPDEQFVLVETAKILLVAGALLTVVLAILLRVDRQQPQRLWILSAAFSLIVLAIIVTLIVLSRGTPQNDDVLIATQTELNSYLENVGDDYDARGLEPPIAIPTGVLIQSARFPDSTSVVLTGYIWQRVPKQDGQTLVDGFTFPQLIDEPMMVEEILREERPDETYVLWSVVVALKQAFDPLEYPFDRHDIKMRLAPNELARNVLLVPDLGAYTLTAPGLLPGLEEGMAIKDWRILTSSFRFGEQRPDTDLGLPGRPTIDVPELNFSISSQRLFLGPFIAFLMPAVVAALMIFAFLLNESKPDEPEEIVTALSYTAALFFVIAVVHTALRDDAAAISLTYLEYFYILLYLMVVFVAINTFIIVHRPDSLLVRFEQNLVSKLLFWPVVLAVMLFATLSIFVFA